MPRKNNRKPTNGMSDAQLKSIRAEVRKIMAERKAERDALRPANTRKRRNKRR